MPPAISTNAALAFFAALMFGFLFLGETTGLIVYFVAVFVPVIYLMAEIHQFMFSALGILIMAYCLVRSWVIFNG